MREIVLGVTLGDDQDSLNRWVTEGLREIELASRESDVDLNFTFSAHLNGVDQTGIAPSTSTKVIFGTEEFDVGSYYSTATSRFTPRTKGKYLIVAQLTYSGGVVDQSLYACQIFKNGSLLKQGIAVASGAAFCVAPLDVIIDMNGSTDYLEIFAYGAGAGNKTVQGLASNTFFQGTLLR